jgi:hypothetical protein
MLLHGLLFYPNADRNPTQNWLTLVSTKHGVLPAGIAHLQPANYFE